MRSVGLLSPERGSYLSRDDGQKYWIIIPIITPAINISRYRLTKLWSAVITNFRWSRQRQAPETKSRMIPPCQSKSPPISPPTKISRPAITAIARCIFYFFLSPKILFHACFRVNFPTFHPLYIFLNLVEPSLQLIQFQARLD